MVKIFHSQKESDLEKQINKWEEENKDKISIESRNIAINCFSISKWQFNFIFAVMINYINI